MPDTPSMTPRVAGTKNRRQTEPSGWNPYLFGSGMGLMGRRGVSDTGFLNSREALMRLGQGNPLRMLSYLPEMHPAVGLATWNALRLSCTPEDLTFTAVDPNGNDKSDSKGTEAIARLWESQPAEVGGLTGLRTSLTLCALFSGLSAIEAVPGAAGSGVARVWPIDSLSVFFDHDPQTWEVVPYQRQNFPTGDARTSSLKNGQYKQLNTNTFFWRAVDQWPDDPYGRAPYAPVLCEVLCDLAMIQDLRDAVHNGAWPITAFGFNFAETHKIASEVYGLRGEEADAWVNKQFQDTIANISALPPGGTLFFDSNGGMQTVEGGKGFTSLEAVLNFLRQRMVQALKSLPTLMGINDGATQTYTSVEWQIYAAGLETIRSHVTDLLICVANLHLQLLGMPLVAKAEYQPIRTTDALIEANTETVRIANEVELVRLGWKDNKDACQSITGSAPVADPPSEPVQQAATDPNTPPVMTKGAPGEKLPKASLLALFRARRVEFERGGGEAPDTFDPLDSNPNHDPHTGQFGAGSGGSGSYTETGESTNRTAEETPTRSARSVRAQQTSRRVGADVQRYSEEHCEPILAKGIKGVSLRDNEPVDVLVTRSGVVAHGVELKTMTDNKNGKITMKADAMARKSRWMAENHAPFHTVVFDDQKVFNADGPGKHGSDSKRVIYYKRGFGSFNISAMHRVEGGMAGLRKLMDTADADLPSKARPPKTYPGVTPRPA